jgi:hypothetical protein
MPAISTCPKCQQPVTIPTGVDLAAHVRCPLCAAEYLLADAIANMPPALIPVDASPVSESLSTTQTAVAEHAFPADQPLPAADGELPEHASDVMPFSERILPTRPKRKQKSGLQTILEIVTGGLAGTLFAYYMLAWWQGPAFDLPRFGLPFIDRVTAAPCKPDDKTDKSDEAAKQKPSDQPSVPASAPGASSQQDFSPKRLVAEKRPPDSISRNIVGPAADVTVAQPSAAKTTLAKSAPKPTPNSKPELKPNADSKTK